MTLRTELIAILDRSGSMRPLVRDMIGGYNSFIDDQRKLPGECRVTLVIFDTEYTMVYQGVPLHEVPTLTEEVYWARGGTALNDAVCRTLNARGAAIAMDKWPQKVLVCIGTDGEENSSKEFSNEDVKRMVEHAQKVGGWEFLYLSADVKAFEHAARMGIASTNVANYVHDSAGAQAMTVALSASAAVTRGGGNVAAYSASLKKADGFLDDAALRKAAEALRQGKLPEQAAEALRQGERAEQPKTPA